MGNMFTTIQNLQFGATTNFPAEGVITGIDGDRIDIQIRNSTVILRNIRVVGDTASMVLGQIVSLKWQGSTVTATAISSSGQVPLIVTVSADNDTIENSPLGIRVKSGGIRPWHLSFQPSMEGHTHMDSLERNGWRVDEDGVIFSADTFIHPEGQISLGQAPNVIKLDGVHPGYRMWIGDVAPESANFAISKDGSLYVKSGEISLGTGNDVAVMSSENPDGYRLWIGNANPAIADFRVKENGETWFNNAHIMADMESTNFVEGLSGWRIQKNGAAEFQNVTIRGKITAVVMEREYATAVAGQQIYTDGAVLVSDIGTSEVSIILDNNSLQYNDFIQWVQGDRSEWMQISADPTVVATGYEYFVQRDLEGSGASLHYTGEVCVRKGTASPVQGVSLFGDTENGFGDLSFGGGRFTAMGGFLTMEGSRVNGPYLSVSRRYGSGYSQIYDVARLGRLNGFLDYDDEAEDYGLGVGDALRYMTYDPTNGLRIRTRSGATSFDDEGITTDTFSLAEVTVAPTYVDGRVFLYFDDVTGKIRARSKVGAVEDDYELGGSTSAGDVFGPSSAVNSRLAAFDTTTGKLLKDSGFAASDFAVAATGVTNGDSHDHSGGDGGQIAYSSLSGLPSVPTVPVKATIAEINTGTDDEKFVTPDGLAGSYAGTKEIMIKLWDDATAAVVGDGRFIFNIPSSVYLMDLVAVNAFYTLSGTGATTIMVRKMWVADMLTTPLTIDSGGYVSRVATVQPVISGTYKNMSDINTYIAIDIDAIATGAKGLGITLTFRKP